MTEDRKDLSKSGWAFFDGCVSYVAFGKLKILFHNLILLSFSTALSLTCLLCFLDFVNLFARYCSPTNLSIHRKALLRSNQNIGALSELILFLLLAIQIGFY